MKITYYLETIAALGLKVGLHIQINELMKLNEIKGQGHYLTMAKGHSDFKIETSSFSETIESFGTKFLMKAYR